MTNKDFMKVRVTKHLNKRLLLTTELNRLFANLQLNNAKMMELYIQQAKILAVIPDVLVELSREIDKFDTETSTLLGFTDEDLRKCKESVDRIKILTKMKETEDLTEEVVKLHVELRKLHESMGSSPSNADSDKALN